MFDLFPSHVSRVTKSCEGKINCPKKNFFTLAIISARSSDFDVVMNSMLFQLFFYDSFMDIISFYDGYHHLFRASNQSFHNINHKSVQTDAMFDYGFLENLGKNFLSLQIYAGSIQIHSKHSFIHLLSAQQFPTRAQHSQRQRAAL